MPIDITKTHITVTCARSGCKNSITSQIPKGVLDGIGRANRALQAEGKKQGWNFNYDTCPEHTR